MLPTVSARPGSPRGLCGGGGVLGGDAAVHIHAPRHHAVQRGLPRLPGEGAVLAECYLAAEFDAGCILGPDRDVCAGQSGAGRPPKLVREQ